MNNKNMAHKHNGILFIGKEKWNYAIWVEMENTVLIEITQTHKDKCYIFSRIVDTRYH